MQFPADWLGAFTSDLIDRRRLRALRPVIPRLTLAPSVLRFRGCWRRLAGAASAGGVR